jgi:hypothetical protein
MAAAEKSSSGDRFTYSSDWDAALRRRDSKINGKRWRNRIVFGRFVGFRVFSLASRAIRYCNKAPAGRHCS